VASTSDLKHNSYGIVSVAGSHNTAAHFHPLKNEVDTENNNGSDTSIRSLPPQATMQNPPIGGSLETGLKREGTEISHPNNDSSFAMSGTMASSEEEIVSSSMPILTASPQPLKKPRAKSALKNSLLGILSSNNNERAPLSTKSENKLDESNEKSSHKRHQSHNTLLRQVKQDTKNRSASEAPKPASADEISTATLGSTMR
jgi:hypothetical protein